MKVYGTYFFDLDGTITDSSLGITNSVMYALKRFGIEEGGKLLRTFAAPPAVVMLVFFPSRERKRISLYGIFSRRLLVWIV